MEYPGERLTLVPSKKYTTPSTPDKIHVVVYDKPSATPSCTPRTNRGSATNERPVKMHDVRLQPLELMANTRAPGGITEMDT
jgi:hypothetical protein